MNAGIDYAAKVFLKKTAEVDLTLRLFTNNFTPLTTSVWADFTECSLGGYAAYTITPADWTGSTVAGLATYTLPTVTFTLNPYAGGTTIYGYVLTIPGVTAVLAELFGTPFAVPAGGALVNITPTYEDQKF